MLQMLFDRLEVRFRQVETWMTSEGKADHATQLFFLATPHDSSTDFLVTDAVWRGARCRVGRQICIVIIASVAEEGEPVVEDRRRCNDLAAVIIAQQTKVAKMAIFIVDQCIEHQHTAQRFAKLRPQCVVVAQAGSNAPRGHKPTDGCRYL